MLFAHRLPHAADDGMRAAVRVEHQLLAISRRQQLKCPLRSGHGFTTCCAMPCSNDMTEPVWSMTYPCVRVC